MADEKGDGGKGRKCENGRCDDGRRGDFRLHGEVRLFSAGGAEIVLKLDGTVVINGQVFEKKEE